MVITSLPSIQILAVSGWRLAVWKKNEQGETGNRKVCCGHKDPSQSSGLRFPSDLDLCLPCPPVNLSTCQLVLPSGQLANRSTDQLIAPSSVIHSALAPLQVAGGSPRWRVAGVPPCLIDSVICHPSSIQSSIQPYPRQLGQHAVLTLPRDSVLK